jgi:uncharacterized membrane protein (UPF0136 family)
VLSRLLTVAVLVLLAEERSRFWSTEKPLPGVLTTAGES